MVDKRIELDAAAALIADGETLGLGGMTIYRRPLAFARALTRRAPRPRELTLLAFTAGPAADLLVGAGIISRTRTCYFGLETFGLAPMFSAAVEAQRLTVIEESEASIAAGLRASMAGVGFMPSRAWLGTDMFAVRPDVTTLVDPYTGEQVTAFPAIRCDTAVIHVLEADWSGNGVLGGNPTIDLELAVVAERTILTAERVVEQLPGPIDIPGVAVDHVAAAPGGAWPTSCYPRYAVDGEALLDYVSACRQSKFEEYLAELHDTDTGIRRESDNGA